MIYYSALAINIIAFFASLVSFRLAYPMHLKFFSILLGLNVVNETISWWLPKLNHATYDIFMCAEFMMYGLYYYFIIINPHIKKVIKVYLFILPCFWAFSFFVVFGLKGWNSYIEIMGSVMTVFFSAYFYYQLFTREELVNLSTSAEFWIATGLIIFYSCGQVYFGMLNHISNYYRVLAGNLLYGFQILNGLMYSLFIYAFLCRIRTMKSY